MNLFGFELSDSHSGLFCAACKARRQVITYEMRNVTLDSFHSEGFVYWAFTLPQGENCLILHKIMLLLVFWNIVYVQIQNGS